jgi:hypothetical protein
LAGSSKLLDPAKTPRLSSNEVMRAKTQQNSVHTYYI